MPIHACRRCGNPIDTDTDGYSTSYNDEGVETSHAHIICSDYEHLEEYVASGNLTSKVLHLAGMLGHTSGLRQEYKDLVRANMNSLLRAKLEGDAIHVHIKVFEVQVWYNGLQEFIQAQDRSGHSCEFTTEKGEKVEFRSLAMCGRWRATLQGANGAFIDVLTEEDGSEEVNSDYNTSGYRMGLNGIGATHKEAIALLKAVTKAWAEGRIKLEESSVRIIGT